MSQFHYRPAVEGGWLAVVMDAQLLLVHPRALEIGVSVFVEAKAGGMSATLDELTRGGLSATPEFALLELTGADDGQGVRAIVRGGVRVTVTAAGAQHTLEGTGVSTWTEQSFTGVTDFEVDVVPEPQALSDDWLPLQRGTAIVSRIRTSVAAEARAASAAAAAPAAPATAPVASVPAAPPAGVSEATVTELPTELEPEAPVKLDAAARPTDDGYDYLFGETMYRNVSEAAVVEPSPDTEPEVAGDHDGMTIMTGDLKKLRARGGSTAAPPPAAPPAPRFYLELPTGGREQLNQPLLVGRAPTASKVSGGSLPRLVTIPGDKDISRNHAQFTVEGETVVVTDLHSRNGTQVIMPGKAPQQLRQGEPTTVIVGTVVDLGGGVTLTVREER